MFLYTESATESDERIKNNNLHYTTRQQYKNIFEVSESYRIHILQEDKFEMISVLCSFV